MLAPADSRTRWSRRRHNLAIMRHPAGLGQLALLICQPWQPVRTSTQLPLQQSTDDVVREAHVAQTERDAAGRWGSSLRRHFAIIRTLQRDISDILCDPWGLNEKEKVGCRDLRGSLQFPASSLAHVCLFLARRERRQPAFSLPCMSGSIWPVQPALEHGDIKQRPNTVTVGVVSAATAHPPCYFQRPVAFPQQVLLG